MSEKSIFEMGFRARFRRVFITPNHEYYREKNLEHGWKILGETPNEITWSIEK